MSESSQCPTCGSDDRAKRKMSSCDYDGNLQKRGCAIPFLPCRHEWHATPPAITFPIPQVRPGRPQPMRPTPPAPAASAEDDSRRCEGCNGVAVTTDPEDVPLCRPCAKACDEPTPAASAVTRAERAERERDAAHRASMTAAEDFANATGRVSKSNVELRALLREAAHELRRLSSGRHGLASRIDALLDTPTTTPTDDDGRGDGRGGES